MLKQYVYFLSQYSFKSHMHENVTLALLEHTQNMLKTAPESSKPVVIVNIYYYYCLMVLCL